MEKYKKIRLRISFTKKFDYLKYYFIFDINKNYLTYALIRAKSELSVYKHLRTS